MIYTYFNFEHKSLLVKQKDNIDLGDRMKMYENAPLPESGRIKSSDNFIIRLDGRSFSKFTSGFAKPFDPVFYQSHVLYYSRLAY